LIAFAALASVLSAGCAAQQPTVHPIVKLAPFDLDCPRDEIEYTHIDEDVWGASGCGKRVKYVQICQRRGYWSECHWIQN
jgi:hypothetical protein